MNHLKSAYVYSKIPLSVDPASLTELELKILSFVSFTHLNQLEEFQPFDYVVMTNAFCVSTFGPYFSDHLKSLIKRDLLEIRTLGLTEKGKRFYYQKDKGLAQQFILNDDLLKELSEGKFQKTVLKFPYVYTSKPKDVEFITSNPLIKKCFESYKGVTMLEEWQSYELDSSEYAIGKIYSKQINSKQISVSQPECGRLFHPIVCLMGTLRHSLRKDGVKPVCVDAKQFHPTLLAEFLEGEKKEEYIKFCLTEDIYSLFVDEKFDRTKIKPLFQVFLSGKRVQGKAKEIKDWYRKNYPDIIKAFKTHPSLQMYLQKRESEIFVNNIFANASFWSLPMHDGLLVQEDDFQDAVMFCQAQILKVLGYAVRLEKKTFTPKNIVVFDK